MASDGHNAQSLRQRMHHWTSKGLNRLFDKDTDTPDSSGGSGSTTAVNENHPAHNAQVGVGSTGDDTKTDPLRLRFKTPSSPSTDDLSTTPSQSQKPYPPTISIDRVDFLGPVHSATTHVKRDLGFQGRLGDYILLSYGDTLYSNPELSDDNQFRGMTSDSLALATHDPLVVVDPPDLLNENKYPRQFCPLDPNAGEVPSEYAVGITNVVSIDTTTDTTTTTTSGTGSGAGAAAKGIIYYLLNHRPGGNNHILGAGVALVELDASTSSTEYPPTPRIKRLPSPHTSSTSSPLSKHHLWFDGSSEPWYGDICALRWHSHIYAYGHGGDDNPWVYVARVPVTDITTRGLNTYEYWNGEHWQKNPLEKTSIGEKESVFWQINQGQVVYSKFLACLVFVYVDNFMNSRVHLKTSQTPEGPWSDPPVMLYQATPILPKEKMGCIYAAVPHPYFDESGKTLVVTFTNHPNTIQAVRVVFKDTDT
ncbi:hypothetical protein HRR83_001398 [Exophiala dermatitidis]|nr:hypothetical protein HRR75_001290 [Exophiala dermatitidis]KAJ4526208.1 hypothetical protein HRR74_001402 [Exophiala dermatitidis]KAJ4526848.1 hypothetical protein HRR73_001644 [Exophiala dermatitidis]KAJ4532556.1 hypothetical protein HRR76_007546 [Exophiala dermatitidis]KAJ4546931.1 hypothetical protein HRR77_004471 [Exophiala dermatitidis]